MNFDPLNIRQVDGLTKKRDEVVAYGLGYDMDEGEFDEFKGGKIRSLADVQRLAEELIPEGHYTPPDFKGADLWMHIVTLVEAAMVAPGWTRAQALAIWLIFARRSVQILESLKDGVEGISLQAKNKMVSVLADLQTQTQTRKRAMIYSRVEDIPSLKKLLTVSASKDLGQSIGGFFGKLPAASETDTKKDELFDQHVLVLKLAVFLREVQEKYRDLQAGAWMNRAVGYGALAGELLAIGISGRRNGRLKIPRYCESGKSPDHIQELIRPIASTLLEHVFSPGNNLFTQCSRSREGFV